MKLVFGYECYPDRDVFLFLRRTVGRAMKEFHGYGQGDVVNALLVKKTVAVGMVDEDPRSTHHRLRGAMKVVRTIDDFELRESEGRYLAIVKPELEAAFIRASQILGVDLSLPKDPSSLRRALLRQNSSSHDTFIEALSQLHAAARARRQAIFLTELIAMIERVPKT